MKTKMMSIFLAFCMLVSLLVPVSAAESTSANSASEQETYEDQFIDNSTYVVDADELPHTPYNPLPIKEENPARTNANSTTVIIHDNPEDSLSTIVPQAVYGPYTTLETMADQKMQVVVAGLKNAGVLSVVKYAGYECYKFSSGVLQTKVNSRNEKSPAKFARLKKGIANQAGEELHRQPRWSL